MSDKTINLTPEEFRLAIESAERGGRIVALEKGVDDLKLIAKESQNMIAHMSKSMIKEYATMEHVEDAVGKAVKNERLLIRIALWGMAIGFGIIMPVASYLAMDKLNDINDSMDRIEIHITNESIHMKG